MANKEKTPLDSRKHVSLAQEAYEETSQLLEALKRVKIDAGGIDEKSRLSLANLRHYQILRSADRKGLQERLFLLGLSSLGRSFSHIAASVENILGQLSVCLGRAALDNAQAIERIETIRGVVEKNRADLLGSYLPGSGARATRVMVTLPSDAAANDGALIRDLSAAGVHIFRINAAHDSLPVYKKMAAAVRSLDLNRPEAERHRIYVDLCGPKIRTGPIIQRAQPIKVGSNKVERIVYLEGPKSQSRSQKKEVKLETVIPGVISVEAEFLRHCLLGSKIRAVGHFEKEGTLEVIGRTDERVTCRINTKLYLDETSELKLKGQKLRSAVLNLAKEAEIIRLFVGDRLWISAKTKSGRRAKIDKDGTVIEPAQIGCTHAGAIASVNAGDRVYIDDGKIGARVIEKSEEGLLCELFASKENGVVLKAEKGINFPDTRLEIPALSAEDRQTLADVADFADMIGLSFAQEAADIEAVSALLDDLKKPAVGLVAKIETARGVANLPAILEALIRSRRPAGVMIARGDLAIEMGFENLAWLQEEILDICTAAHLPVIWATQVLENQMKTNLPSRAEITDAAMGSRAECVMLNKGAFAVNTIRVLEQILSSFHELYLKNRQLLGKTTLWEAP